jgi:hypothetical protein
MLGADATLTFGMVEVNGQYLHREDTNPSFTANGRMAKTDGGFVEAVVRPENSRFHFFGLYNLINSSAAVINLGDGAGDGLEKYESYTGGLGYLLRRNLRVNGEMTWDTQMERARWSLGFVTAF